MNKSTRSNTAERFGRWLGRGWGGYMRCEQHAVVWMVAHGLPAGGAKVLVWVVKLIVFGVLLYVAFWLALLLLFVVAAAWVVQGGTLEDEDDRLFMTSDESSEPRNSLGYDPNLYNDTSHEMYEDDERP